MVLIYYNCLGENLNNRRDKNMKTNKKYYFWAFQITKKIIFEVEYYILGGNKNPYFSTSANEFNQPKTDFARCGQAQDELLSKETEARKFWEKWDRFHLHDLTLAEYGELLVDIQKLKTFYNFIELEQSQEPNKYYRQHLSFCELKELSMQELKKARC